MPLDSLKVAVVASCQKRKKKKKVSISDNSACTMKPLLTTLANYLSRIDAGEKKKSPEPLFKRQTLLKEAPLPD